MAVALTDVGALVALVLAVVSPEADCDTRVAATSAFDVNEDSEEVTPRQGCWELWQDARS